MAIGHRLAVKALQLTGGDIDQRPFQTPGGDGFGCDRIGVERVNRQADIPIRQVESALAAMADRHREGVRVYLFKAQGGEAPADEVGSRTNAGGSRAAIAQCGQGFNDPRTPAPG